MGVNGNLESACSEMEIGLYGDCVFCVAEFVVKSGNKMHKITLNFRSLLQSTDYT